MSNKKISLVVPTLGQRENEIERLICSLNDQVNKEFEVIFVSQDNHDKLEQIFNKNAFDYKHIKLNKKGLSYARNEGLKHITGQIVTFSDDDCWYPQDALLNVLETFNQNNTNLICFQIYDPNDNVYYKKYKDIPIDSLETSDIFKVSSIEIFIDLKKVKKEAVFFDERFGLGSQYPSGEENILLHDLRKKQYIISYIPKVIVYHNKSKLNGKNAISIKQFTGKGPLFRRMSNFPIAFILINVFFIKKFKRIERPFWSYLQALKETLIFNK